MMYDMYVSYKRYKYQFVVINTMSTIATEVQEQEEEMFEGVAVCGSNLSTPVVDRSAYINEICYKIGNILYIENAD